MESPVRQETADLETAKKLGLLPEEYDRVLEILGRPANFTELSIFSVMWSEHCSYKNSIKWLKTLPKKGEQLLAEAGEENAGLVDIGEGMACAFKIESHNHPSAIEPYQGAATGVGGINRDIFTMGARPVAQLNSLRFGNLDLDRTKWLLKGVVKGIGDYGNSFGIPVVGGEVYFDSCYNTNPLVNAMSVGLVRTDKTISAISYGVGNPVFIVGSATGKDGIHGATFASEDITESSAEDLPSVQVGDPFQEKLLLEATMELAATDAIIGMQDMGAAGIICSTSEMSAKGEHGMRIDLDLVPTRQEGMLPFEILLSESQERMLVVVKKGREEEVIQIFEKWDLNCVQIGEVVEGNTLSFYMNSELVAEVPAEELVLGGGAPVYEREYREPESFKKAKSFSMADVPVPDDLKSVAYSLLKHPNIASRQWVSQQYDSMVGTVNMSTNAPSDAAVVNLRGTNRALALTVDCNSRYVHADPYTGAAIAVAEAARNIVCTGGQPQAITNCLNFGNPYNPNVYWQFVNAIQGMGDACRKFQTPVTGGNVSFYNQSAMDDKEVPVFPTPTIGMLGIVSDKSHQMTLDFKSAKDKIFLLGKIEEDIASSQYLVAYHGVELSPAPYFNLDEEKQVQDLVLDLIQKGVVNAVHDCAEGGLWTALSEMGFPGELGFEISCPSHLRIDAFLFGEAQGRVVVTTTSDEGERLKELLEQSNVPFFELGHVTTAELVIAGNSFGNITEAKHAHQGALQARLEQSSN